MARPGRMPKPTELRVLEGNREHRPLPKNEPKPRIGAPPCPSWLDRAAKREWRHLVDEWARTAPRLLTRVDGGTLEGYCVSRARWIHAEKAVAADLDAGRELDRNKVLIAAKYLAQVHRFGEDLGLSPAARARLTLPAEPEEDDGVLS